MAHTQASLQSEVILLGLVRRRMQSSSTIDDRTRVATSSNPVERPIPVICVTHTTMRATLGLVCEAPAARTCHQPFLSPSFYPNVASKPFYTQSRVRSFSPPSTLTPLRFVHLGDVQGVLATFVKYDTTGPLQVCYIYIVVSEYMLQYPSFILHNRVTPKTGGTTP